MPLSPAGRRRFVILLGVTAASAAAFAALRPPPDPRGAALGLIAAAAAGWLAGRAGRRRPRPAVPPAEAAVRESEALLRLVWESAADGMRLTDAAGTVVMANPAYCRMVGRTPAEVVGRSLAAAYAADRRAEIEATHRARVAARAARPRSEAEVDLADGRRRWFDVADAYLDAPGAEPLYLGVFRDVTRRKWAEAALRESEERYRALFTASPHPTWVYDAETLHFLAVNDATVARYGYARDELLAMTVEGLRAPGPGRAAAAGVQQHRWKDGTVRDVEVTASPVRFADRPAYLVHAADVTDRRRAEAARRESDGLLQTVLAHIPCGVFWKDRASRYLGCNDRVARDFGLAAPADLVGRTDLDTAVAPAEAEHYRACDRRVMETGEPLLNHEETQTRADGAHAVLLTSKVPLRDPAGAVVGVLGVYQDITARKRLDDHVRQKQKMEAVGHLAGGIAHDFNNLLTVINGYTEILVAGGRLDARTEQMLAEVHAAGERAADLTRQLLAFSRKAVLQPKVVELNRLVANLERMLARLIGEDVRLVTTLHPAAGRVRVDPGQLEQVVLNLAVNARDAMPTGGRLAIATDAVVLDEAAARAYPEVRPGRYARLAVTDTGCGMTDAVKARVFEPFFTTKAVGKGTGLGLATVYGIVQQSGGHVAVDSAVGVGTTFRVLLPAADVAAPAESGVVRAPAPRGAETILLVEDEPRVLAMAGTALRGAGYQVVEAGCADEAVRAFDARAGAVDLLLTDVVMPGVSGRELAERLVAGAPGLRVLYMSGYTDDAVVRHGLLAAEVDFIQKPFAVDGLLRRVRAVLDRCPRAARPAASLALAGGG